MIYNRQKITPRTEPVSKINEHALVQIGSGEKSASSKKVQVEELLKAISEKPRLSALPVAFKQLKKKGKTLEAPLEKPLALRVCIYYYLFLTKLNLIIYISNK